MISSETSEAAEEATTATMTGQQQEAQRTEELLGNRSKMNNFQKDEQVTNDGKNRAQIMCQMCPSVILRSRAAQYMDDGPSIELPLPYQKRAKAPEDQVESTPNSRWWAVKDMMTFENVGFTHSFHGQRFLACADCEIGPIGVVCNQTGQFLISPERVMHKQC